MCDLFVNVSNGVVWFVCHYYCLCLCGWCLMCVRVVCGVLCDVVGVCCCAFVMCLFVVVFVCASVCIVLTCVRVFCL